MHLMDSSLFYKGFNVNYNEKALEIYAEIPSNNETLMDVWESAFRQFDKVNVCLSGGIDSQFVLSVLSQLEKNIHVYIFSFIWEDNVINSPDVLHAIRLCHKKGYKYTNIEIDYKNFLLTNQNLDTCKKYKTYSPQVSVQLKMIDYIEDKDIPVFLGGDVPLISYDSETKLAQAGGVVYQPFITNAFLNYGLENDRIVIKDLFRINPVANYLGYKQSVDTVKAHKLYVSTKTVGSGATQKFRKLFYTDIGAELLPPLLKNTGFESLKIHFAKESGIYNQYDLLFRAPIINTLKTEPWYNQHSFKVRSRNNLIDQLVSEFENFCRESTDLKQLEAYSFDL